MNANRNPSFGILLIDDEPPFLRSLSIALERGAGFNHIYRCEDSRDAMEIIEQEPIGLVLLDLTMPHLSGEELLQKIVQEHPEVGVIIVSGLNQLETAVQCIRLGAYDYFVKTTEEDRLIKGICRAVHMQEMRQENQEMRKRFLSDTLERPDVFANIITQNKGMRSVFQYLESVSNSSQPVLICGESGVGKEQIAQAIHTLSNRSGNLISVNVAGLDDNVFADTLFGHSKGAFTGADKARSGMIEQATNGTLFLDEIGDLSLTSQVKLLRLLQEGEYYPLGSDRPKRIRARVIVATHQNLEKKLKTGEFRKDLYYRLRIHQVEIPSLRHRKDDIPLLLEYFLTEASAELGKNKPTIPKELVPLLANYSFPGNIRELKALAYDAISQHQSKILSMEVFRRVIDPSKQIDIADADKTTLFKSDQPLPTLQEVGDLLIEAAMDRAQGNQSLASRLLGISQPALSKRLKKKLNEPL
ncbi:sigma-54-dependent transcriptional regulator [Marinomonas algicola]|uniref:sigma-54-dependent transcriptional regulator n=1 Tax=Marinomonas algicola TaxID=2773454 RepID=UPI00174D31E0|nr:sigma-54 dependent transcriptional regulator [Marinomonas algicola]